MTEDFKKWKDIKHGVPDDFLIKLKVGDQPFKNQYNDKYEIRKECPSGHCNLTYINMLAIDNYIMGDALGRFQGYGENALGKVEYRLKNEQPSI